MAPPKRKTTGRVTPKGTKPGEQSNRAVASDERAGHDVEASSRYTPKRASYEDESPRWVPILMFVLLGLGALTIFLRYVVWQDTNWPVLIGLGFMLGGLWTATKWR